MKTTPEMFESGTFPPYSEVAKAGHDKIAPELDKKIAQRRRLAVKHREDAAKEKKK